MATSQKSGPTPSPADPWPAVIGGENLLILALRPGDESMVCGGLIARCCRRGRPPFVVVLTDGSTLSTSPGHQVPDTLARLHERETRAAVQCLGLPAQRLLMAGLFDGTVPVDGPAFEAVVRGIALVMWARDCNIICAAAAQDALADQIAASRIAAAVARQSGVGLLWYQMPGMQPGSGPEPEPPIVHHLDIRPEHAAKRAAIEAHATRFASAPAIPPYEAIGPLAQPPFPELRMPIQISPPG